MNPTPPPTDETDPSPRLVTWCAWRGDSGPPPVPGRTAEDAEKNLLEYLARFYGREAEVPSENPRARARQALPSFKNLGLTCHCSLDEGAAFTAWVETSSLAPEQALTRWRIAFPIADELDPLAELAQVLQRRAHEAGLRESQRRWPLATQERFMVLGRLLDKLPRMSEPGVGALRRRFEEPTG